VLRQSFRQFVDTQHKLTAILNLKKLGRAAGRGGAYFSLFLLPFSLLPGNFLDRE
jgi:hypothetical protein